MSGAGADGGRRPNPECHDGALIWWAHVPTAEQNYLQAVLEGYGGLAYYQTFHSLPAGKDETPRSLARLTSTPSAEDEMRALLGAFSREIGLEMPDCAPAHGPLEQPKS